MVCSMVDFNNFHFDKYFWMGRQYVPWYGDKMHFIIDTLEAFPTAWVKR